MGEQANSPNEIKIVNPIKIALIEGQKSHIRAWQRNRYFWGSVISILLMLAIAGIIYKLFVYPRESPPFISNPLFISLALNYPTYYALGDEGHIELTLVNEGNNKFSKIKAIINFTNSSHINTLLDGSSAIEFGNLDSGERKTRIIKFILKRKNDTNAIKFNVKLIAKMEKGKKEEYYKNRYIIRLLPLPYIKSVYIGFISVLGVIVMLIISQLIKLLERFF